jgi:aryl-alcohol dehydrogenase-like predicted oxidoreductase
MERRAFGRSGMLVPCVGMGTWKTFDVRGRAAEAVRHQIVGEALAAGANFFDSSPMYGEAERVLGEALAGRREAALVATKVWAGGLREGRQQIRRALDWFGGRVDFYQIHNLQSWETHLPVLEEWKAAGTVRAVGATHYAVSSFPTLRRLMETGRLDGIQIPYSAVTPQAEAEILPLAQALGLGVVVMTPFEKGDLTRRPPAPAEVKPFEAYGTTTWAQVLLKWILSDPRVHVVIPATSRPGRMAENAAAGSPPWFPPEVRERVARLAAHRT